jgi:large subunit ribosomal protein L6
MSRIGKLPVAIPAGVRVKVDGPQVVVEGPKGRLEHTLSPGISVEMEGETMHVRRGEESRSVRSLHGLSRKLLANMVAGVSTGFTRTLEIVGVGYRADLRGTDMIYLTLGYSHPIVYQLPPGVTAKVERQVVITLESHDRQLLGQVAAEVRALRGPEPYKGKGIKYAGETIRRKAGKAAGAAGS